MDANYDHVAFDKLGNYMAIDKKQENLISKIGKKFYFLNYLAYFILGIFIIIFLIHNG